MKAFAYRFLVMVLVASAALALSQKDWMSVATKEGSLTMSVPSTWIVGDSNDPRYKEALEEFKKDNPAFAKHMGTATSEKQIAMLYDASTVTPEGYIDALVILKQPHGGLTAQMYGDVAREIPKSLPVKGKFEHKVVDLPVGKALSYWCTFKANLPGRGEAELDMFAAMFLKGENLYIATFSTPAGNLKSRRETWEKVLKSFKAS